MIDREHDRKLQICVEKRPDSHCCIVLRDMPRTFSRSPGSWNGRSKHTRRASMKVRFKSCASAASSSVLILTRRAKRGNGSRPTSRVAVATICFLHV